MANIAATQTNNSDLWGTPIWLFKLLDEEFRFNLDVAASEDNALCLDYYTEKENGLIQAWYGNAFCNPPYSQAAKWMEKAYTEAVKQHATTVMLVAARTDTRYFWNYAVHGEIRFLPGRLKFVGGKYSAPFPSAIVIFHRDIATRAPVTLFWNVREEKQGRT